MLRLPKGDLHRFFEQLAFTVMVSNGDGHLKNFGVLYTDANDVRLAPMFDVLTTRIYRYAGLQGGPDLEDQTLALKLLAGKGQTRTYPATKELLRFGRDVCRVAPQGVLVRIGNAMSDTLDLARQDDRIPPNMLADLARLWESGMGYAS